MPQEIDTAQVIYDAAPARYHDKVDGDVVIPWNQAVQDQPQEYFDALKKAEEITASVNPQVELLKVIGKKGLLHEFADFTWYWGVDWFVETRLGNFHWKDPSYGPDESAANTLTYFDGDIHKFRDLVKMEMGRDKGSRFIVDKCGEDFELILPE